MRKLPSIPPFLLKALVVPLAVATFFAMWISVLVCEPWAGLLVNLAAGFVGTAMTVLYVDVVLRRHDAAQWKAVEERVCMRVERLANISISSIRSALQIGTERLRIDIANDKTKRRAMMMNIANNVLTPKIRDIRKIDVHGWNVLAKNLQQVSIYADHLLTTFGPHLEPDLTDGILNLQDVVDEFFSSYSTFPDIFGVPTDMLPARADGSSAALHQDVLYEIVEDDLKQFLAVACGLLSILERDAVSRNTLD